MLVFLAERTVIRRSHAPLSHLASAHHPKPTLISAAPGFLAASQARLQVSKKASKAVRVPVNPCPIPTTPHHGLYASASGDVSQELPPLHLLDRPWRGNPYPLARRKHSKQVQPNTVHLDAADEGSELAVGICDVGGMLCWCACDGVGVRDKEKRSKGHSLH